ncbi:MAG: GtrA family protein [Akkermansiaceae bacterium]|nr:GtrA family protein [Akkermansiaceae bacterium]
MTQLLKQASRFGIVGIIAMIAHFALVVVFVNLSIPPLIANVIAFLGAFQISYWGHVSWSFAEASSPRGSSLRRFFMVATSSFLLNEILFAILLEFTSLTYQTALILVLTFVAGLTFFLSRHWAFAHQDT